MPICVLLIDNNACHAQVVVSALADPWLGWQVDVATSVAGLRAVLAGLTPADNGALIHHDGRRATSW